MALLMAGMIPEYFRAVGAFVPITNLSRWYDETDKYKNSIIACCGGESRDEMLRRSPISYIDNASIVPRQVGSCCAFFSKCNLF